MYLVDCIGHENELDAIMFAMFGTVVFMKNRAPKFSLTHYDQASCLCHGMGHDGTEEHLRTNSNAIMKERRRNVELHLVKSLPSTL